MIKAEAILPKKFNPKAWDKHFEEEAEAWAAKVNMDYNRSHLDWSKKNKPKHKTRVKVNRSRVEATVEIQGKVYAIVHQGSPAHKIRPKGNYKLKFQKGYKAKTAPGYFASFPGGAYGPTVRANEVDHPGFPGRFQSKAIKANRTDDFKKHMQRALSKGVKDCGHAL